MKYESPQGSEIRLDVPEGVPAKLKRGGIRLPLIITEGAKKVDAAVSAGMLAVGLPGAWTFKRKTGPVEVEILPDLVTLARYFENRQVVIGFDADSISNPNVYRAMQQLGQWIEYEGASALYLNLPEVNGDHKAGLDDFLAAGGTVEKLWTDHVLSELPPRKENSTPGRRLVLSARARSNPSACGGCGPRACRCAG